MKCSVCGNTLGWGALVLSSVDDEIYTVNICGRCKRTLLGSEVCERVTRFIRLKAWVQPRLPSF